MQFLLDYAKRKNPEEIYATAKARLRGFYEKLGFKARGEVYEAYGIDHIVMYLKP